MDTVDRLWTDSPEADPLDPKALGERPPFTVYLELQVASRDNLFIHFDASYPKSVPEPGMNSRKGWARGNHSFHKRTIFALKVPTNVSPIDYHFDGTWWSDSYT
ncbi:hypothetical protein LZ30DRAFT_669825 [Colletotrichum cereale]|nr:hypothetical protein LZ30DRAFT_669825 [Colletotrichum cereale]